VAAGAGCRVPVVDLTHDVPAQDVCAGSFLLSLVLPFVPAGSVVVAVVDPGVGAGRGGIIVHAHERWIVAPDNGLVWEACAGARSVRSWVLDRERVERAVPGAVVPVPGATRTFDGRDLFVPAGVLLGGGIEPDAFAHPGGALREPAGFPAIAFADDTIEAPGRWIDPFGNILTALTGEQARSFAAGRVLRARAAGVDLGGVVDCYAARPSGDLVAVCNSWGRIEVARVNGNAAAALGVRRASDLVVTLQAG